MTPTNRIAEKRRQERVHRTAKFFLEKMRITKGARFNASRRLKIKASLSLISISFLSIYAMTTGMIAFFFAENISEEASKYFNIVTIVLTSFILFLNAFESSKMYELRSEKMRMSAQRISDLFNEFDPIVETSTVNLDYLNSIISKYNDTLREFAENHDDIDFLKYKFGRNPIKPTQPSFTGADGENSDEVKIWNQKISDYKSKYRLALQTNIQWAVDIYLSFAFFVVLPPIMIVSCYLLVNNLASNGATA